MVKGKARAAGSFLGGLANNPAIVIIALVLGGLLIFRGNISKAFADLGGSLGDINIQLPEIKFPEFKFPEFKFPEIDFPDFPDFPDLPDFQGLFTGFQEQFTNLFQQGGGTPDPAADPDLSIGLAGGIQQRRRDLERGLAERELEQADIPLRDIQDDIEGLTPSQAFAFIERGVIPTGFVISNGVLVQENIITPQERGDPLPPSLIPVEPVRSFLIDEPTQQFTGGGPSFIGGSIFETPITAQSTLSFIIDKLGVSASRAASIRAELRGFTEEEALFLAPKVITPFGTVFDAAGGGGGGVNVSDQQFAGLTPQQIVLQLTGGNISNF